MAINKVVFGSGTLIDLSGDTVAADKVAEGIIFHAPDGTQQVGTMAETGSQVASPKDVNFIDYDGTLLYGYTLEEMQALTALPDLPSHDGLTCQGWNWTLAGIKALGRDVTVGATYITNDGKTRLYIKITAEGRMSVPLYWTQTVSDGVSIDWGDGSTPQTFSGTGAKNTTHTYAAVGDYIITLDPTEGCTVSLGNWSSTHCVLGPTGSTGKVYNNMLYKVEIGRGVIGLHTGAFNNCYSLVSVTIPASVIRIESYVFQYCYSLLSAVIPSGVTNIGNNAFAYCGLLSSVAIPDGVTGIGNYAFADCYSLDNVTIPNGVTSIGASAFSGCAITSILIPDGVLTIGNSAFYYCRALASVTIPNSVTVIGDNAFYYCRALNDIELPSSVTSIGDGAFYYCCSLSNIVLPTGIAKIGSNVFNYCQSLASITIPDGVTSIGSSAFNSCYSLANVNVPSNVNTLWGSAFSYCYGMSAYYFQSTEPPTLSNKNAFSGIPNDCVIYVPAASVDAYKTATNWSNYASKIQAMP